MSHPQVMSPFPYKSPKDHVYVEQAFSRFDQIEIYKNVLSKDLYTKMVNTLIDIPWGYGRKSTPADRLNFWYQELTKVDLFRNDIFKIILDLSKKKFKIHSIVANGQTFGQDGEPHHDTISESLITHTFLLYASPLSHIKLETHHPLKWNPLAGGKTLFLENIADVGIKTKCVDPIPNSAVLFPADMVHYGEAYHRAFAHLRVTIAYKLIHSNE